MKIGLSIYSLWEALKQGMTPVEAMEWIVENGGEHMELVAFMMDLLGNEQLQREIKDASIRLGLPLSAYCLSGDVLDKTPEEYACEIKRLKAQIDVAARMGVPVVRHDLSSFSRTPEQNVIENYDRDLQLLIETCRELADYAAQYGITTTIENHGQYINGGERVRRLILGADRPNFKCMLDVGNALCVDEDPVTCVQTLLPLAQAVHFKDFYLRHDKEALGDGPWFTTAHGNYLRGAIVGHGELELERIMHELKQAGYDGYVTVEFEGIEDCKMGSKIGMDNVRRMANASI